MEDKLRLLEIFYVSVDNEIDRWRTEECLDGLFFKGPTIDLGNSMIGMFCFCVPNMSLKFNVLDDSYAIKDSIKIGGCNLFINFTSKRRKLKRYADILYTKFVERLNAEKRKEREAKEREEMLNNVYLKKAVVILEDKHKKGLRREKLKNL